MSNIQSKLLEIRNLKLEIPAKQAGFSVIEVIFAAAIFIVFATGIATTTVGGLSANRLGEEQTIANQFASEGIESVRSIKNQAFANLVNSAGTGVAQSGGIWTFSGANNQYGPSNKYTRIIKVEDAQRDGSGNIVASGGTVDSLTKKITSTVSWNANSTRADSVVLSTYLSDFRKTILAAGGLLVYGDGTTSPKYRMYDTSANTFGTQTTTVAASSGQTFIVRTSPTKTEAIAGFVTSAGVLNIQCFDGTTWTQEWTVTVGGTGTTRRFDIAYETNSGDVMVLYSTNTGTTNELAYRTKLGSTGCGAANWASATNFDPIRTSGVVQWVKMAWDRRASSNLITALWADANSDLSAAVWSGSAWGNEPAAASETSLQVIASSQDLEDFDIEYESLSGDIMMVWGNSIGDATTNGVRYRTCTGGTAACTWNAVVTTPPTWANSAANLDISANPNTDEIVFGSVGSPGSDLQVGYWNGSAWTNTDDVDTSCNPPVAGSKFVTTGWLISGGTTRSIVAYGDQGSNTIDWFVGNGGTFTKQADFILSPAPNPSNFYIDIQMNPLNKAELMYVIADSANDLFAKRVIMDATPAFTWTNADGAVLQATLPQNINSPFSFAYWRN